MQKWEYKDLDISSENGKSIVSGVDGSEVNNWRKGPHFTATLDQLGAEGWELVTSWSPYSTNNGFTILVVTGVWHLILKRPKA